MRRRRKMSRTRGLPVEGVDARPARRRARSPRRRRRSTCTRRAPSRRASGSDRRPRAGRSRGCAPPTRGESRPPASTAVAGPGRRSARRARGASGPTMASAARRGGDARARSTSALPITSVRSRVTGHHHAPSVRARGAEGQLVRAHDLELAHVRDVGPAPTGASRCGGGVVDGDVPAVAQLHPRAGGQRLALHRAAGDGGAATARGTRSEVTSAAPRRRGRRTAGS